jgi:hypothetical protein
MRYWHDVEGADNGRGRSDSGLRGNVVVLVVMVNRSRRSDRRLHHSRHVPWIRSLGHSSRKGTDCTV